MPGDRVNGTIGVAVFLDAPRGEAGTPFPTFFCRLSVWGLSVWPPRRVSVVSEVFRCSLQLSGIRHKVEDWKNMTNGLGNKFKIKIQAQKRAGNPERSAR